jgi:uncharacterized protein (DUF58 family)
VIADPTHRLAGLSALLVLGGVAAVGLGIPALAAAVVPLALFLVWGLGRNRQARCQVSLSLDHDRAFEEETVTCTVSLLADRSWERVLCELHLPAELVASEPPPSLALEPGMGGRATGTVELKCLRWGVHRVGPVTFQARHRFGLFLVRGTSSDTPVLRVYPAPVPLHGGLEPNETQVFAGNQRARQRGEGLEFADIRPYLPGDQVRRMNWRVTARRRAPYVNLQHPERNADVVLFIDTFADVGQGAEGTMAVSGRAAAALAELHLARRRDRVGVVTYGGVLQWLAPGMGSSQLYRVLDTLIEAKVIASYARPSLEVLPPRTLPAKALVVAFSPLLEDRTIGALLDIRGRGFDLAVIEVDPERYVDLDLGKDGQLSLRVWRLWRAARRRALLRAGIPLVRWDPATPLDAAVVLLNQLRRQRWTSRV